MNIPYTLIERLHPCVILTLISPHKIVLYTAKLYRFQIVPLTLLTVVILSEASSMGVGLIIRSRELAAHAQFPHPVDCTSLRSER